MSKCPIPDIKCTKLYKYGYMNNIHYVLIHYALRCLACFVTYLILPVFFNLGGNNHEKRSDFLHSNLVMRLRHGQGLGNLLGGIRRWQNRL